MIIIIRQAVTTLRAACLSHWTVLTFQRHLQHLQVFVLNLNEFYKFRSGRNRTVDFTTIYEQQITFPTCCGMGDVEFWLVGFPESVLPPLTLARPSLVRWAKRCVHDYGCPFGHFEAVCTVSWHAALSLRHHRTPLTIDSEPRGKEIISQMKTETHNTGSCATNLPASPLFGTTNFPMSPQISATNLQFLSYKATETGVGSVSRLLLRTLSHRQNWPLVLRYRITQSLLDSATSVVVLRMVSALEVREKAWHFMW